MSLTDATREMGWLKKRFNKMTMRISDPKGRKSKSWVCGSGSGSRRDGGGDGDGGGG